MKSELSIKSGFIINTILLLTFSVHAGEKENVNTASSANILGADCLGAAKNFNTYTNRTRILCGHCEGDIISK